MPLLEGPAQVPLSLDGLLGWPAALEILPVCLRGGGGWWSGQPAFCPSVLLTSQGTVDWRVVKEKVAFRKWQSVS